MRKIDVSVLVPVYNVEKYLPECLDSLVGQTLEEIEIICINDGSTDGSLRIIKQYARKDKRVKLIDKANSGYGDSMNMGLAEAKGEYVGIVEPDDFVDLDAFEKMYKLAKTYEAEVVKVNFYEYKTEKKSDTHKSGLFLRKEVGKVIDPRECRHIFYQQPSIWSAIYKWKFLEQNQIRFLPSAGASYQDAGFNFKVFATARRVYYMDEAFLHYRCDNPDSSVKSEGKVYAVKEEYDEVERYLKERGLMKYYGDTLAIVRMGGYIWNMRRLTKKSALEFSEVVKKDYERYKRMGYLKADGLEADAEFIVNNLAVRDPDRFIKVRFWYELNDKVKMRLMRTYKKMIKKDERNNDEKV